MIQYMDYKNEEPLCTILTAVFLGVHSLECSR